MTDEVDIEAVIVETTQPGGGLLMRVTGEADAYLWADSEGAVDVERVR